MTDHNENEVNIEEIAHNAVETVNNAVPRQEFTLRMRLALLLAVLVVIVNTIVGVYNSVALRSEISCNHQLNIALNVVADQNRTNTKDAIDAGLDGNPHTRAQILAIRKKYDDAYKTNGIKRQNLLSTTCASGS